MNRYNGGGGGSSSSINGSSGGIVAVAVLMERLAYESCCREVTSQSGQICFV